MDQHVTYHLVSDDTLRLYPYYVGDDNGITVAAQHCDSIGMDADTKKRFLDLLPHFAAPADHPFDQTHAFSIALTQGFFGPYYYINDAQLSRLGDVVSAYTQPWQQTLPDFATSASAQNHLLSKFSAGVFIAPSQVAQFMSDAHAVPELTQALAVEFPGDKLAVLWSALQAAHDMGAGLLEAAGAIEPNAADLASTPCFTRLSHCDAASLQTYVTSQTAQAATQPAAPVAPELPVPPHLQDKDFANPGERLPSTPSLTERLREKRGE